MFVSHDMGDTMKRVQWLFLTIFILIGSGCTIQEVIEPSDRDENQFITKEKGVKEHVKLTPYANEIGFSLISPEEQSFEAKTHINIEGNIEQTQDLNSAYLWVLITGTEEIEHADHNEFNYYVAIEDQTFSKQLTIPHGAGEYEVSIRVPSRHTEEVGMYYDVATFTVNNQDEEIEREVAYTEYGVHNQIQLISPEVGYGESEGTVNIEGIVPSDHQGDMILVQVVKGNEKEQLTLAINDSKFEGEVPLYFGDGYHFIQIQMFNEEDELYYEAANFYVNNERPVVFAEVIQYSEYLSRGVSLDIPSWSQEAVLSDHEYRIVGEVDQTVPRSDEIDYIIATVNNIDEDLESTFLIPVENYQFDGLAFFRFGSGHYEVVISVPNTENQDQSKFYYQGIIKVNHQVTDIEDKRALLPARGIESEDPIIIQQAEDVIEGLDNERDKAKAIYKFVAEHVAYDVEKAENDIFNIGDSALSTLQSGIGICQDYTFLAIALLRAIGMEANFVEGDAGERHAWVEVKVDDDWIVMDPTWGSGYVQGGTFYFDYNEAYFDPEPDFLDETHTRDGIVY